MTKDQILKLMIKGCLVEAGEDTYEIDIPVDRLFFQFDPKIDLSKITLDEFKQMCKI